MKKQQQHYRMKRFILRFLGWTALLDIPLFFGGVLLLLAFNAYLRFNPQEPYFELFLTKIIYQEYDDPIYYSVENPKPEEKLNIEWIVNVEDLRSFREPRMKIINHGGSFYANSRDVEDNYWIHICYITYRGEEIDSTWDGMGCGTGMFYQPVDSKEEIEFTWYPSLFDKINTPYYYEREEPTTAEIAINEIFGDSTEIYWTLLTFSTPWSNYVPQVVQSPSFMLYPNELKATWNEQIKTRESSPMFQTNSSYNLNEAIHQN